MYAKSNHGLGYKEYVYLQQIGANDFLILNDCGDVLFDEFLYKKGEIKEFEEWELEPLNEKDFSLIKEIKE